MLKTVIEHWAKARIDSPLQLISRLDDAGKQVITVAGLLQGALIAVSKFGDKPLTPWALGASVALLTTIVLAAIVLCLPPHDMWAHQLYRDLRCAQDDHDLERQLDGRFKDWCTEVSNAAKRKRYVLTGAILTMVVGLSLCVVCLEKSLREKQTDKQISAIKFNPR